MEVTRGPRRAGEKSPAGIRRHLKGLSKDRQGVATIEFAILAVPFFLIILVLLETATIFMAELVMDHGVAKVGREVRTGQITNSGLTAEQFKNEVCAEVGFMFDCSALHVDLKTYDSFALIPTSVPVLNGDIDSSGFSYTAPDSEKITALKVYYKWPVYTDMLRQLASTMSDNSFVIVGSAAFVTEPY